MSQRVLFVDDDQRILNGIRRQFEGALEFETANSPEAALDVIADGTPFAVVVSDMRMPGMNGAELLSRVKDQSPDTVRIILTGCADLTVTINALNEGTIFRFLSKPCPQDVLEEAVHTGLTQYRLVTADRELLESTLHGSIKVLSEMLSLVSPLEFGRTSQVQRIALAIGEDLQIPNILDLKIATMLFPLGYVTVSDTAIECAVAGRPIPEQYQTAFSQHAAVASNMLKVIPRLEPVAAIVAYQDKRFDGSGDPDDDVSGNEIPLGARILKVASDFEIAYKQTDDIAMAFKELGERVGEYDPNVLKSLGNALRKGLCQSSRREVSIDQLTEGMVLASDVRASNGKLMVTSGQEVTESIRRHLCSLYEKKAIEGTFAIQMLAKLESTELATH